MAGDASWYEVRLSGDGLAREAVSVKVDLSGLLRAASSVASGGSKIQPRVSTVRTAFFIQHARGFLRKKRPLRGPLVARSQLLDVLLDIDGKTRHGSSRPFSRQ